MYQLAQLETHLETTHQGNNDNKDKDRIVCCMQPHV